MLRVDSEIVVFPSVEPTAEFFEVLPLIAGEAESFVRGRGFDLYRIRDYSPEDDARHLDWKASAKSGGLKVREFTREDERRLRIVFDNPAAGDTSPERYEEGLELAASIAWHFASENADMSYAATDFESQDLFSFLRYLALVEPMGAPSVLDRLQESGAYNVIITAKPRGTIRTALWSSSYVIFLAR
jgi:hypothetical protein